MDNLDLERNLQNYNEMGTSIRDIRSDNLPQYAEREPFKDIPQNGNGNGGLQQLKEGCTNCDEEKNFNVNSFIKDLEKNLDNFDNIDFQTGPMPSNLNENFKNQKKEKILEKLVDDKPAMVDTKITSTKSLKKTKKNNNNNKIYNFLIEIREPVIIILLFILLNNPELKELVNKIPYIDYFDSPFPSLILRGSILAIIIYYLKKYSK